jgi:hypothetical protein
MLRPAPARLRKCNSPPRCGWASASAGALLLREVAQVTQRGNGHRVIWHLAHEATNLLDAEILASPRADVPSRGFFFGSRATSVLPLFGSTLTKESYRVTCVGSSLLRLRYFFLLQPGAASLASATPSNQELNVCVGFGRPLYLATVFHRLMLKSEGATLRG